MCSAIFKKFIIGAKWCNSPETHKLDCVRIKRVIRSLNQNYRLKSLRDAFSTSSEGSEHVRGGKSRLL